MNTRIAPNGQHIHIPTIHGLTPIHQQVFDQLRGVLPGGTDVIEVPTDILEHILEERGFKKLEQ
jgi:predicted small metal-binding protein